MISPLIDCLPTEPERDATEPERDAGLDSCVMRDVPALITRETEWKTDVGSSLGTPKSRRARTSCDLAKDSAISTNRQKIASGIVSQYSWRLSSLARTAATSNGPTMYL